MRKLREVLRLSYSAGLSIRKISASTKISVGSIQNILKLAVQLKITWPLPEDWDERGVAIFAKACFGHPSPSKRQKSRDRSMPAAPQPS
jgi:hypothetical protein